MAITSLLMTACSSWQQEKKPNIIYILADDLGYGDLSSYGQEKFSTPNIDRLAKEGIRFTQHYSGSAVCAPSRSTFITGQHTGHTFIRGNREHKPEGQLPLPSSSPSLAKMFRQAGYVTGAFGKWGLGYPNSEGDPVAQGFNEFYGYNCQREAHHYYPQHLYHNNEKVLIEENAEEERNVYAPYLIHDQALKFIEENKDKPFFMYYPSTLPHAELLAPEEYMNKYRGKYLPEKSYKKKKGSYASQKEGHAAFAAMINVLDDQVGDIMAKLEELGIADNTLVIFTSDNGPHGAGGADPKYFNSNGGLRGKKRDLYEGGIKAPFIARWPGKIKGGSQSDHISAFWDMLPTFAEIAGGEAPAGIDSNSILPALTGKGEQAKHELLYWEFHERGGKQAVRMGKWKAVRINVSENPDAAIELYDLENDPGESIDLAGEQPEIVAKMVDLMKSSRTESEHFQF
ncbi:MAG: arylsulfatase [Bacteroidota bacterium]